jgi:hypothetical protein
MPEIDKYETRKKEDDARRHQKPWWNRLIRALCNVDNIQTTLLAAFTGVLIIVGVLQKWTLDKTNEISRSEQRAWIAPRGAEISAPIALGGTVEFQVIYENTGKEPAFDVVHQNEIGVFDVPLDARGIAYWANWPVSNVADLICSQLENFSPKSIWVGERHFLGNNTKTFLMSSPTRKESRKSSWIENGHSGCRAASAIGRSVSSGFLHTVSICTPLRTFHPINGPSAFAP